MVDSMHHSLPAITTHWLEREEVGRFVVYCGPSPSSPYLSVVLLCCMYWEGGIGSETHYSQYSRHYSGYGWSHGTACMLATAQCSFSTYTVQDPCQGQVLPTLGQSFCLNQSGHDHLPQAWPEACLSGDVRSVKQTALITTEPTLLLVLSSTPLPPVSIKQGRELQPQLTHPSHEFK